MSDVFLYRAFGLLIRSELELPEYRPHMSGKPEGDTEVDIEIKLDTEPLCLRQEFERREVPIGTHLTDDGVLLHVDHVGDMIIRDGCQILVAPLPDAEMNYLRLYLVGSAMGILFHQRRQFIFHGAAVLTDHGASVFVGHSGAGKSTLAAHLASAGFPTLADDTLPLREEDGTILVWPGAELFKMWDDALTGLGEDPSGLTQVSARYGKYFLMNPQVAPDAPAEVTEVIVLEQGDAFSLEPISGLDAIAALNENTYRPEMIGFLGTEASYLLQLGSLCQRLSLYRFTRPRDAGRLPEAVDFLRNHWSTVSR
ncbi:MAG: hypothetical protein AAF479_10790 [Pseudomonadota bacterium]